MPAMFRVVHGGFPKLKNVKHEAAKDAIFAVKYYDKRNIFWNTDINAARNILHKCLSDKVDDHLDPHFQPPTSSSGN